MTMFHFAPIGTASRRRLSLALLLSLLACFSLQPERSFAQASGFDSSKSSPSPLTLDMVRERLNEIDADSTLDTKTREQAVANYNAAREFLERAKTFEEDTKRYNALNQDGPKTLAKLREQFDDFAPEPTLIDAQERTLVDISAALTIAESDLSVARARVAALQTEKAARLQRRAQLPEFRSNAEQFLGSIPQSEGVDFAATGEPERSAIVERWARRYALEKEVAAYGAEMGAFDVARDVASLRIAIAERDLATAGLKVVTLQNLSNERREVEAKTAARKAAFEQAQIAGTYPELKAIAAQTAVLAGRRTGKNGLSARIASAKSDLNKIDSHLARMASRAVEIRQKVDAVGFSEAVGLLLRKELAQLPDTNQHLRAIRSRRSEIGQAQFELMELDDRRMTLQSLEDEIDILVEKSGPFKNPVEEQQFRQDAYSLLESQRDYIDALISDYDVYFGTLVDVDAHERELVTQTLEQKGYIDEHVLWIRSTSAIGPKTLYDAWQGAVWLFSPSNSLVFRDALIEAVYEQPVEVVALGFLLIFFVASRGRLRRALADLLPRTDTPVAARFSMQPIFRAAAITAALSLQVPAICYYFAWVLKHSPGTYVEAVAAGLAGAGVLLLLVEIVIETCREGGLGIAHLGWPKKGTVSVQRYFTTAAFFSVPVVFVVSAIHSQPNQAWQVSLGRLALMANAIIIGVLAYRVLRPSGPLMRDLISRGRMPWLKSAHNVLYLAAVLPLIFLVFLTATGFYYLAISVTPLLGMTFRFALVLVVVNSVILRWMLFARRRLAIQRSLDRRKEQLEAEKNDTPGASDVDGEILATSGASEIGLAQISEQNRRLLRGAVLMSFGIGVWYIWRDVLPAFRVFDAVELWSVTATTTEQTIVDGVEQTRQVMTKVPITLGSVLLSGLIIVATLGAGRNLPGFLELTVLQRLPFDAGERYAVTAVSKYVIVSIGMVAAFGAIGIGWSQVQWLVAAMTVGLGFGLQEIFANFVSGLIILIERPIRVGDTVTLGTMTGRVCRIQIRATTVLDWDRKELIVPNKAFITDQLINWSLSDPILRLTVPVGIAYGSDTALAERVLMEVAAKNEFVLEDPASQVVFNEFGDSSLTFHLRVFIASIDTYWRTQHSLHMEIDAAFRRNGIEIAFPQRDLHIRSFAPAIPIAVEPRS